MGIGRRIDPTNQFSVNEKTEIEKKQEKETEKKEELLFLPEEPKYTFENIILPESVKDQILDIADYAENSKIVFDQWGLNKTHKYAKGLGINLYGAPGTGKTMAAHAIAHHLQRPILAVNYADIESKYVGETPKNIRRAFEAAKKTNSILFFDEADAILSKRVSNMSSATDVSVNQTRSVMLMIMNDYQDFIIFATNFIENFDPAFMRRISTHVEFKLPDLECRKKLWTLYIPNEMPNNIDIEKLANDYEDISGGDISNAVLKAAFKAARKRDLMVYDDYVREMVESIKASKQANQKYKTTVERKEVSEEYVKKELGQDVLDKKEV